MNSCDSPADVDEAALIAALRFGDGSNQGLVNSGPAGSFSWCQRLADFVPFQSFFLRGVGEVSLPLSSKVYFPIFPSEQLFITADRVWILA